MRSSLIKKVGCFLGLIFTVSLAFAGGSVGTLSISLDKNEPKRYRVEPTTTEIVYNIGLQQNGMVKFAYARTVNKKWAVQQIELSQNQVVADKQVHRALQKSKLTDEWAEVR